MGYNVSYLVEAAARPTVLAVLGWLRELDPAFDLRDSDARSADLYRGQLLLGEIELTLPGDGSFEDELEELDDELEALADDEGGEDDGDVDNRRDAADDRGYEISSEQPVPRAIAIATVRGGIAACTCIVNTRIAAGERGCDQTLALLAPLWDALARHLPGYLLFDDRGYFRDGAPVLLFAKA